MKFLTHPVVSALGIATFCLFGNLGLLVSTNHIAVYHQSGDAFPLFAFAGVELVVLWVLLALLLLLVERLDRIRVFLWSAILFLLPWLVLKNVAALFPEMLPSWLGMSVLGTSLVVSLVFVSRPSLLPVLERILDFAATILGFAAMSGVIVIAQLIWFGWQARDLNSPVTLHRPSEVSSSARPKTRVIWIVLDELSYQQVYEQRFAGLQLPAFDRLAAESTVFTHTIPAGMFTEAVIPSLLTGRAIDRIRASADGQLAYTRMRNSGEWQRFNQHDTVFQDALDAGLSTGVAGWYIPYCRILPQVLDRCFWVQRQPRVDGIMPGASISANLEDILRQQISAVRWHLFWKNRTPEEDPPYAAAHISDFRDISAEGDSLLKDHSADFIFLHIPVPHLGGIYNRKTGEFATTHSNYIDNLALADRYLAHVRAVAEQAGDWDSSVVIVMGDHSWRTQKIYIHQRSWTIEEQLASHGGQFDDRPAYILKLPGQQKGTQIDTPFAAENTRKLLDALIGKKIGTPEELSSWVANLHEKSDL